MILNHVRMQESMPSRRPIPPNKPLDPTKPCAYLRSHLLTNRIVVLRRLACSTGFAAERSAVRQVDQIVGDWLR